MHISTPALLIPLILAALAATTPVPANSDPTPATTSTTTFTPTPHLLPRAPARAKKVSPPPPPPPPRRINAAPRTQWGGAPRTQWAGNSPPSFQVRPGIGLSGGQWTVPKPPRVVGGPRGVPPSRGAGGGGGRPRPAQRPKPRRG
ncbi:uncharacterized protein LAJ45_08447 [Morchella importuna]|uniref:uncharacterized protein n=1 Tax=Morchella importuna TaxID=1174673 RepID=UPI001E8EADA3|nr:uncharacterized protein LAJ45_08447 [Morchella importuna]KAH8147619.1 hypothetical protein LAJ45_08447 [Morchella importuna]